MPTRPFLAALFTLFPALSLADVWVPDTLPGRVLSAWLDAFNSGDRARLESFTRTYLPAKNPDNYMGWREEVGGYDLLEIYSNDKTTIFFRVKARINAVEEAGRLTLSMKDPLTVTVLGTWRIPPGARFEAVTLDTRARHQLIERVAGELDANYVFPEIGNKMAAALRTHEARGEYRAIVYGDDFAPNLTEDLREISHDKHVEVTFSYFLKPAQSPVKQAESESRRLAANNCGFEKAEHLAPNIGYLKLNGFADTAICAQTASAAMAFLANSDALIFDLRDNLGGGGGMCEFLASYLFSERTHLNDIISRVENATKEAWTSPDVPGKKFIGKPVYLLRHASSRRSEWLVSNS